MPMKTSENPSAEVRLNTCMHHGDSACQRVQEGWTWMGSFCPSSVAICLAMRAGVPAYLTGCAVQFGAECAAVRNKLCCLCLLACSKRDACTAERDRCGRAWQ